jgi:hypothetical protein
MARSGSRRWRHYVRWEKGKKKIQIMGRKLPQRSCRKSWRDFDPPSPGCLNSAVERSKMTCASDAFARYTLRVIEEGCHPASIGLREIFGKRSTQVFPLFGLSAVGGCLFLIGVLNRTP